MSEPGLKELKDLYIAVNEMFAKLGMEGEIDADDPLVEAMSNAIYEVDNGEYLQGETLNCVFNKIFLKEYAHKLNEMRNDIRQMPFIFKEPT